ncbi:BnaC03g44330D [Brassica napus]|uniref:(rape) hypothetical protein n=1 Tax=Brassica napus TaxID=3708 RepID=A0A078FQE4_BRANA|nr:unnamed protein product [Brassica napus]CDY15072.1 BnaC03g44330D [Brassica napus]
MNLFCLYTFVGLFRHDSSSPQFTFSVTGVHSSTHLFQPFRRVCLEPESRAPSSSSSQAWLVVVVQFVFQPAEPDSSSATPVIISVVAELPIEKLDCSSNGSLVQVPYSVVLSVIVIVGISRGNRRNRRDRSEEERQW